jgi:hypothetical protein
LLRKVLFDHVYEVEGSAELAAVAVLGGDGAYESSVGVEIAFEDEAHADSFERGCLVVR